MIQPETIPALLEKMVMEARTLGADAAEAVLFESTALNVSCRIGKLEDVERSESRNLGLRVFVGQRQAVVSSTFPDTRETGDLTGRALAMARVAPEDPYTGLADPALLARDIPDLELSDGQECLADALAARAKETEEAALGVQGVANSNGASAGFGKSSITLVTSDGFTGQYETTSHSCSCSVLAGNGNNMERDYDYDNRRYLTDLADAAAIGKRAGEKAVRRLGAHKVPSQTVPVVFDPRVSNSLIGHLAGAVCASAIARGTSFLKTKMNARIFPAGISIIDDPRRKRGLRSRPFDGEGVVTQKLNMVEDGVLKNWFVDTASGRQLGLGSLGHATRGTGSPPTPGPSNLYMTPGSLSPAQLMSNIKAGLYVTEMMGMGINGVTGDYSRGASGFWIENGKLTHPVNEITIAGNLLTMFEHLTPADDLEFRYGSNAPTLRIEGMTIAGT